MFFANKYHVALIKRAEVLLKTGWCRGALAKDKGGREIVPESPKAVRWCLIGALLRAQSELKCKDEIVLDIVAQLRVQGYTPELASYNDTHSKGSVLKLVEAVRKNCEGSLLH